jgi:hypothetical protein
MEGREKGRKGGREEGREGGRKENCCIRSAGRSAPSIVSDTQWNPVSAFLVNLN